MIEMENIAKTYHISEIEVPILKGINLQPQSEDYDIQILGIIAMTVFL
jgi:ABC-type lipoprotein export system ATPase subunit